MRGARRRVRRPGLALALALAACGTPAVHEQHDASADFRLYQAFDWLPQAPEPAAELAVGDARIPERVRAAIGRTLVLFGYRKVEGAMPDFYVTFHVVPDEGLDLGSANAYYGTGSWGVWKGVAFEPEVDGYEPGTLVVDVADARQKQLVWRGVGRLELNADRSFAEQTHAIDQVVYEILLQFPPRRR